MRDGHASTLGGKFQRTKKKNLVWGALSPRSPLLVFEPLVYDDVVMFVFQGKKKKKKLDCDLFHTALWAQIPLTLSHI